MFELLPFVFVEKIKIIYLYSTNKDRIQTNSIFIVYFNSLVFLEKEFDGFL
jgi:hypothetical protein